MTRETHTTTAPLYLHLHGIEEELDAIWSVRTQNYPAEPTSWGAGRGTETEVESARLISWHRHGVEYSRADAIEIEGEADVIRQEKVMADSFDPSEAALPYDPGLRADWLRDERRDRDDIAAARIAAARIAAE